MNSIGIIREFNTRNFRVVVEAEEEIDLDLSFDDTGDVARDLDSGELIAFCAHAYVVHVPTGAILANDYLGNCIYKSLEQFADHIACGKQNREYEAKGESGRCGSYFSEMVHTVCQEAREQLVTLQEVKVRRTLEGAPTVPEDSADGYYISKPTGNVYKVLRRGTDDEGEHIELQRVAYVLNGKTHLTGAADHVVIGHITMEWLRANETLEAFVPDWAGK